MPNLSPPPTKSALISKDGTISQPWLLWLQNLYKRVGAAISPSIPEVSGGVSALQSSVASLGASVASLEDSRTADEARLDTAESRLTALETPAGPVPLKSYPKASVPSASANTGKVIWVSDATGGAWAYVSNGTNWKRMSTEAVLS